MIMKNLFFTQTMPYILLIIFTLVFSMCVSAEKIYKTVNKDGTVTFSDQPSPGASEVDFASNTSTVVTNPRIKTKQVKTIKQKEEIEYTLTVMSPSVDETIRDHKGDVSISAMVNPSAEGYYQLSLNDKKLRSTPGTFLVEDLPRGEYSYQINFVSASGKVIASSSVRRFFVHKPSMLIKPQTNRN